MPAASASLSTASLDACVASSRRRTIVRLEQIDATLEPRTTSSRAKTKRSRQSTGARFLPWIAPALRLPPFAGSRARLTPQYRPIASASPRRRRRRLAPISPARQPRRSVRESPRRRRSGARLRRVERRAPDDSSGDRRDKRRPALNFGFAARRGTRRVTDGRRAAGRPKLAPSQNHFR
jgi:hypothetical protein